MDAIRISKLTKTFESKHIFDHFDLSIQKGEMVAITGPSGCGKTTLLNIIGLIEPFDDGTYKLFGNKTPKCNSRKANETIRNQISFLFQNFALIDHFTVEQNLMLALKYVKQSKEEKRKQIQQALKMVDLVNVQDRKVYALSGGEQQRIALARAILKPSKIILADEPTGALDTENRDEVLEILRKLNQNGKTILIVTHDAYVAKACDRVIKLG